MRRGWGGAGRRRARSGRGRVSVCVGLTVSNGAPPKDSKTQKSCNQGQIYI